MIVSSFIRPEVVTMLLKIPCDEFLSLNKTEIQLQKRNYSIPTVFKIISESNYNLIYITDLGANNFVNLLSENCMSFQPFTGLSYFLFPLTAISPHENSERDFGSSREKIEMGE